MSDAAGAFRLKLSATLVNALKTRDSDAVRVLRGVLAALDNAGAIPQEDVARHAAAGVTEVPRTLLSGPEIAGILHAEIGARQEAADTYRRASRGDEVTRLDSEMAMIQRLLDELRPTA